MCFWCKTKTNWPCLLGDYPPDFLHLSSLRLVISPPCLVGDPLSELKQFSRMCEMMLCSPCSKVIIVSRLPIYYNENWSSVNWMLTGSYFNLKQKSYLLSELGQESEIASSPNICLQKSPCYPLVTLCNFCSVFFSPCLRCFVFSLLLLKHSRDLEYSILVFLFC